MFSIRLKELRTKRKLTQSEFAKQFNISNGAIGNWESGKRTPDSDMLVKIANFFNVTTDYLLGNSDEPSDTNDITFDDFTYAFYDETKELTEEDKQALLQMAKILKKKSMEKNTNG